MNQDQELMKPEEWYPSLCPPKTTKEKLLQDEDFTKVDETAKSAPASLKDSFNELIQHLTSHLTSDLHKLRAIFSWMGAQEIGYRQETESISDEDSPRFYLKRACEHPFFIGRLFVKMCRAAKIPCILVKGQVKSTSYDPTNKNIKLENIWAVVYVASSWRFVFPHWAFIASKGHQKENWMLVEDSGQAFRTRFKASNGELVSYVNEFFFLTDPEVMKYMCYPDDTEKQLLTEPWTEENFFASPYFSQSYFSSGWILIRPLTGKIKTEAGRCFVDLSNPEADSKLKYQLFFDQSCSESKFPQEFQMDRYATMANQGLRKESIMMRLPVTGTYKLVLAVVNQAGFYCSLVEFGIVCDYVEPEIRPFPPQPQNQYGFTETALKFGLSKPSHKEGTVQVKSGEKINISFNVPSEDDVSARLLHNTRTPEQLRNNVSVGRDNNTATVNVKLPADDPSPEYSLEIEAIKSDKVSRAVKDKIMLNYLLTSDNTFQEARYKGVREELLAAMQGKNLDRLNRALENFIATKLQDRGEIEKAKTILLALCKEEMEKTLYNQKLEEMEECLNKIAKTCVGKEAREKFWFKHTQQLYWNLEEFLKNHKDGQLLTDDKVNVFKSSEDTINVLFAVFILLGENQSELSTWQKIWTKMNQITANQLHETLITFDDSVLTQEQVALAEEKLMRCDGSFHGDKFHKTLYLWCLNRVKSFRSREKCTKSN